MGLSIRAKIVCIAVAILFFAVGINTLINGYVFRSEYSEALEKRAIVTGETLKFQLEKLLALGIPLENIVGFEEQCQELVDKYDYIAYAKVVGTDGKVLFKSETLHRDEKLSPETLMALMSDRETLFLHKWGGVEYYDILIPVASHFGRFVGAVVIGVPVGFVTEKVHSLAAHSIGVAITSLILAALFLFMGFSYWVRRPLMKLIEAINDIREKGTGLAEKVEVESDDEIGLLASNFNEMLSQIQLRDAELERHHKHLEGLVRERTEKLEEEIMERKRAWEELEKAHDELEKRVEERTATLRMTNEALEQEIFERSRAENRLKHTLSQFKSSMESSADGLLVVGEDGKIITSNRKFSEMWGIPQDVLDMGDDNDVLNYVLAKLKDPDAFLDKVRALYASPEEESIDRIEFRDGRILERYSIPQWLDGQAVGRVWSFRDITEREKAEEARKESEERFYEIFRQNEDALFMFDPVNFKVIDANPAAESLFGYSRDELLQGEAVIFDTDEYLEFMDDMTGVDRSWVLAVDHKSCRRKGGTSVIVSIRGKIMKLKDSNVLFCSIRDMTEKIQMEEEAKLRQLQLIQANKMTALGTLVSGVAHEINNPNAYILTNILLLRKSWKDIERILKEYYEANGDFPLGGIPFSEMREAIPQLIAGINDGSRRIKSIIGNLKHFARKDRADFEGIVDVNAVLVDAMSILNKQIEKYTKKFAVAFCEERPLVKGNAQQLEQVIINLMMNALQALPDSDCRVSISTYVGADGESVVVEVRDEGVGMAEDVLERITEPFFTTKFDAGGTGLGLSISYSILKDHNAHLKFHSRPGKGTTVEVRLPMYKET